MFLNGKAGMIAVSTALLLVAGIIVPVSSVAPAPATAAVAPAGAPAAVPATGAPDTRILRKLRRSTKKDKPWNVVVILTDDQPMGTLADMRTVRREIAARGIEYPSAFVPTPLCCPSRASLLTGLFAEDTGVYDNGDGGSPGGYPAFKRNGNEKRTIATALKRRGYRTALFGKYMNEYGAHYEGVAPRGWDKWRAFAVPSRSGRYRHYPVTTPYDDRDRRRIAAGKQPRHSPTKHVRKYSTTYFGKLTADFIRDTPKRKPLLAVYAPYAPHSGYDAARKYRGSLTDTEWWRSDPSIMEADVSDKPEWVSRRSVQNSIAGLPLGAALVKQRQTLLSVDDEVDRILSALEDSDRLKRTVIFYVSDNGYVHGQHRLSHKSVPYRAATEVPLVVRYGNKIKSGLADARATAANVDLAATILAVGGAADRTAGYSLLKPPVRTGVPLVGVAFGVPGQRRPPYCGWRTPTQLFVRYASGEEEFYDYASDPYELTNRVDDPAAAGRVAALRNQARAACDPVPPGFGASFNKPDWRYSDPGEPDDGEPDEQE